MFKHYVQWLAETVDRKEWADAQTIIDIIREEFPDENSPQLVSHMREVHFALNPLTREFITGSFAVGYQVVA